MIFAGLAFPQDYIPLDKIKSYCMKTHYFRYAPMNGSYSGDYYSSVHSMNSVKIFDTLFYDYKIHGKTRKVHFDSTTNKLLVYDSLTSSIKLAFDFNTPTDSSFYSWFEGFPLLVKCMVRDSVLLFGKLRPRIRFWAYPNTDQGDYYFVDGLGLYRFYIGRSTYADDDLTLYSAVIDTNIYNPFTVTIDSTDITKDRELNTFPFILTLYGNSKNIYWRDSFYVSVKVFRADSCALERRFNVDDKLNFCFINIKSGELHAGDSVCYNIVFTDTSIFSHRVLFPDSGSVSFKVLPVTPTGVGDTPIDGENISLSDPYPNPFNSTTRIDFLVSKKTNVGVYVFDVLGNMVEEVYSGEAGEGKHSFNITLRNLSSGVYFIRLVTSGFTLTKKILYLK